MKVVVRPEGAREGDIPYYCRWEDGSEYEVRWTAPCLLERMWHGPQFGLELGDWQHEEEWR